MATIYTTVDTGGTGDYISLSAWNAGEATDLTIAGDIHVVTCKATTGLADTSAVDVSGWTTNSSNYIVITADQNHGGAWNSSIYRIESSSVAALTVRPIYTVLSGIQVNSTSITATAFYLVAPYVTPNVESPIILDGCIAKGATGGTGRGFFSTGTLTSVKIKNCLAYDYSGTGGYGFYIHPTFGFFGFSGYTYNNTVINCAIGFDTTGGDTTIVLSNNLAIGCTDGFAGSWNASSTNNCSDIVSDALGINPVTGTPTFVDYINDDFNLAVTDTVAKDAGTNLLTDPGFPVLQDSRLVTRPQGSFFDIGFSEATSSNFKLLNYKIESELKNAHEYSFYSIGAYLRKFKSYPDYIFEVQSDGSVSWQNTSRITQYPLKNKFVSTQEDKWWDGTAIDYINSGIIPVSGVDEYQFQMRELYDTRISSGFVNALKNLTPSPKIIGNLSTTSIDVTGWARQPEDFSQVLQSGVIDTLIIISGQPWYLKKIPSSNDVTEYGKLDRAVGYNYRTDIFPSGQVLWEKYEIDTGIFRTGFISCDGNGIFYPSVGYDMKQLNLAGTALSTHGWTIAENNSSVLYKIHEQKWRNKIIQASYDYANGNIQEFLYSIDRVEFSNADDNKSYLYRNNVSGLSSFQNSADWYPGVAPGTGAGTPDEIDWAKWQGYISNSGIYNSLDSTTTMFGSQADKRVDGNSLENALWVNSIEDFSNTILSSGLQSKFSLSGRHAITTLSGIQDRLSFVSDVLPATTISGNTWYTWSSGEIWEYINNVSSSIRAKETSFTPVIGGYTETENTSRFGKAFTALTDQTHVPMGPGSDFTSADYYHFNKLNLGNAINKPYKNGTWVVRDFTNGKIEINDTGINVTSTDDVYSKVKIDIFDITSFDIPNLWLGWLSDRYVIYADGVTYWKSINDANTSFFSIVGQQKPIIDKQSLNYYDAVSSGILSAGNKIIDWDVLTVYLVVNISNGLTPSTIVSHHSSSGNRSFDIQRYSGASQDLYRLVVYTDDYPAGSFIQMDDQAFIGQPGLFCFQYKSGNGKVYRNGILEGSNITITGPLQGGGPGIPLTFGGLNSSGSYSQQLDGAVYALFICNSFHDTSQREAVEAILTNRYNL